MDDHANAVEPRKLIIGSRKSQLAVLQSERIISLLQEAYPELNIELVTMSTTGDKILDKSLSKIGEKNLFTKELEYALEKGEIDAIVHSLKDLPTTLPPHLCISAIDRREIPYDVFIARKDTATSSLSELPKGSLIGSSSLRRIAQLKRAFPHITCRCIRGNLNTRLAKLDNPENDLSGIILAAAGVRRMGWADRITEIMDNNVCYYAVSQGALGVEIRRNDDYTASLLHTICDEESILRCISERSFLRTLDGGCSTPVGVRTTYDINTHILNIQGRVLSYDGDRLVEDELEANLQSFQDVTDCNLTDVQISAIPLNLQKAAFHVGASLANTLLNNGADILLKEAKDKNLNDIHSAYNPSSIVKCPSVT